MQQEKRAQQCPLRILQIFEKHPLEVLELWQPLSPKVRELHSAIREGNCGWL
jgi:hypothetical protein